MMKAESTMSYYDKRGLRSWVVVILALVLSSDTLKASSLKLTSIKPSKSGPSHKLGRDELVKKKVCDELVVQYYGYLNGQCDTKLFYWFFGSRKNSSSCPTLVYLQGGPGVSSLYSALSGNGGPCIVDDDTGLHTRVNPYSWNTYANMLYIDQPAKVGFSKGNIPKCSVEASESTYLAISEFFSSHPEYNNDVYLAGQSYAGHFIPPLAAKFKERKSLVQLKGIILGNADVMPEIQWDFYLEMAKENNLIDEDRYHVLRKSSRVCVDLIHQCNNPGESLLVKFWEWFSEPCAVAWDTCHDDLIAPVIAKGIDIYHLDRKHGDVSSKQLRLNVRPLENVNWCCRLGTVESLIEAFMRRQDILRRFGNSINWSPLNSEVTQKFRNDRARNYHHYISRLIDDDDLRALIFHGDRDYACNWMGGEAWTKELEWRGSEGFRTAKDIIYKSNDDITGTLRSFTLPDTGGQLNFIRVYNAGHNTPMDAPRQSLKMLHDFLNNQLPS